MGSQRSHVRGQTLRLNQPLNPNNLRVGKRYYSDHSCVPKRLVHTESRRESVLWTPYPFLGHRSPPQPHDPCPTNKNTYTTPVVHVNKNRSCTIGSNGERTTQKDDELCQPRQEVFCHYLGSVPLSRTKTKTHYITFRPFSSDQDLFSIRERDTE